MRKLTLTILFVAAATCTQAQIGSHRNNLSVGINGGYVLSSVGFSPKVPQKMHGGMTAGVSVKYTTEKYFNTYCSLLAEINYASIGWKENIADGTDNAVINPTTGLPEKYSRTINYLQIPIFAHLAWGKEEKGAQFFFHAGPQFGIFLNEKTKTNFDHKTANLDDRANTIVAQDTMAVENKFDYGIAAGIGMEYTQPKAGHFIVEARYYYGLGNIYGDSKKDFFGKSNLGNIVLKFTYLFDLIRTKK